MYKKILALLAAAALLIPQALANPELPETLIPGGHTVGIRLKTDGVIIIGFSPVETTEGTVNPAEDSGLMTGDRIKSVDNKAIATTSELIDAVAGCGGSADISFIRDQTEHTITLRPAVSKLDGTRKMGVLIRDSMSGIGTMTFYDPQSGLFGALGHGVNDSESGTLLPIAGGDLIASVVEDVQRGVSGQPGELRGQFPSGTAGAEVYENSDRGLYGKVLDESVLGFRGQQPLPLARPGEVKTGPAQILCNIDGDTVRSYQIEIIKLYDPAQATRHLMLRVTDPELLAVTGGIVQGMSGSPILQNGKLVGAVTHVLINDPERGYGILIDSMLRQGYQLVQAGETAA